MRSVYATVAPQPRPSLPVLSRYDIRTVDLVSHILDNNVCSGSNERVLYYYDHLQWGVHLQCFRIIPLEVFCTPLKGWLSGFSVCSTRGTIPLATTLHHWYCYPSFITNPTYCILKRKWDSNDTKHSRQPQMFCPKQKIVLSLPQHTSP